MHVHSNGHGDMRQRGQWTIRLHEAMCGNVYFMFCHSPEVIA